MIKKTYIRVITLILAALMMFSMLAPMFSRVAFAASLLEVSNVGGEAAGIISGTPTSLYSVGDYEITVESPTTEQLGIKKDEGSKETVSAVFDDGNKVFRYGGLRFEKKDKAEWQEGDTVTFSIVSTATDGEPKITASNASTSRVRKGRQVTLNLTIVDTNFIFNQDEVENRVSGEFVLFEQGDFKRSGANIDTIVPSLNSNGQLQFAVQLKDIVYTGSGDTAKFTIGYKVDGKSYEYDMSIKVDGCVPYVDKDDDNDDDDDEVNLDPLTPHIIVNQYDYGTTQVSAGQVLDLDLSFSNTSNQYDLDNIVMKITTPEGFAITSSSNTYYFDNLDVGESISQTISLQANPSAEAKSHAITIDFSFQYIANDVRKSGESSESISIPVSQPDRFSVDEIQVPTSIYVGEEYNLSVNFVNKGKAEVYNVTAELRGNVQNSGERTFIGNVNSGTENSADFYVTPTEAGKLEGEIIISYEDSNMNVKEISKPFMIQVEEYPTYDPGFDDYPTINPEPVEEPGLFTVQNVVLGIVAVGVAGATGYMTVLKIKAKRSEFDDEDL